jgi:hypothetical protein
MLPGLNAKELELLKLSVGPNQRERPLTPIQVAGLLKKTLDNGGSLPTCATYLSLQGTTMLSRFLKLLELDSSLHGSVSWGHTGAGLSFTTAVSVARLKPKDQLSLTKAIRALNLQTPDVRKVTQLVLRTGKSPEVCISEVVDSRASTS